MPAPVRLTLDDVRILGSGPHATIPEDTVAGTRVGRLGAADPDGDALTYTLLFDGGGRFFISGNDLRVTEGAVLDTNAFAYPIRVRVTDANGETLERDLLIAVSNVEAANRLVRSEGTDGDDTLASYGIAQEVFLSSAGDDTVTGGSEDIVAYAGRRADYAVTITPEIPGGYGYGSPGTPQTITVRDLRPGGPDGEDLIIGPVGTLRFADGDWTRGELDGSASAGLLLDGRRLAADAFLDENASPGTVVGTLSVRGRPAGEAPTVTGLEVLAFHNAPTFIPPDSRDDLFAIAADGTITVTGPVDFEAYSSFGLRVFYADALGNPGFDVIAITVDDVNDAPSIASAPGLSGTPVLAEHSNLGADVLLGDITLFDQDGAPNGVVFSLSGPDAALFKVVGGQLFLRAGVPLAFEEDPDLSVTLSVRDRSLPPGSETSVTLNFDVGFSERAGTAGADTIVGTAGRDVVRARDGDDRANGGGGGDLLDGGRGADVLNGAAGADLLAGGAGADTLVGDTGSDTLEGGYGADLLNGGEGNDVIRGDLSPDPAAEAFRWNGDLAAVPGLTSQVTGRVAVGVTVRNDGALLGVNLTDAAQYVGAGEPFAADSGALITGGAGPIATLTFAFGDSEGGAAAEVRDLTFRINDVDASGWQDALSVAAFRADGTSVAVTLRADGNDVVSGATVTGGEGADEPDEIGGSVLVTVAGPVASLSVAYANLRTEQQVVTLTDVHFTADAALLPIGGNDALIGGTGDDTLLGGLGRDTLHGGEGDDVLAGGAGGDILSGDAGRDVFRLDAATDSGTAAGTRDVIRDFEAGLDRLDWSALRGGGGGPLTVQAVLGAGFSGLAGEVRVASVKSGGRTLAYADLDGDRDADVAVVVMGVASLGAADFLL